MSLTNSYLITTKNLSGVINSVISAKAPERFTNKFLEDLGFKSSNDRLYVGVFKALGLIDENGVPTPRYHQLLDQSETEKVLAVGIQEAYEDLFNLRKDAQTLNIDEIKGKLKTLTQGQKSEKIIGLMANTFKSLCELADWTTPPSSSITTAEKQVDSSKNNTLSSNKTSCNMNDNHLSVCQSNGMNLHYNIQIHLPETTNTAVYDAIFQSLKKHLM